MNYCCGATKGTVLGIGHGAMRDGPGWRSIVYFKGCNFKCRWCGSPDTISQFPEIAFYPDRVKYAESILSSCPSGSIKEIGKKISLNRSQCAACSSRNCADAAFDGSFERKGTVMSVDEILEEILPYRRASNNYGVTISGGEAALQWDFYIELLKGCRGHGFNTAVETNGSVEQFPESFPLLDLIICDLKIIDPSEHRRWTGRSNRTVLRNIKSAAAAGKPLWIRIPVIPGINDGDNIDKTIEFLLPMKKQLSIELLGYHRLGVYKWETTGRKYSLGSVEPPDTQTMETLERKFRAEGFDVLRT